MIAYASNTGTRRNLDAMRRKGWRILLTPLNPVPRPGIRFAIDNGAWSCHQSGKPFNNGAFIELVERHGGAADFVVIPDIVSGGMESLAFSSSWMTLLKNIHLLLLPLQDGKDGRPDMTPEIVGEFLRRHKNVGLFLGGSTEWKLRTMHGWGMVAHAFERWYHVGRVNTKRRIRLCAESGADSFDGTSATRFSCNLPMLDSARRQGHFFGVRIR